MLKEKIEIIRKAMILIDGIVVSLAFFLAFFVRKNFYIVYKFSFIPSSQAFAQIPQSISDYLVVLFFVK